MEMINVFRAPKTQVYTTKSKVTISILGRNDKAIFPEVRVALSMGIRTISQTVNLESLNFKGVYILIIYGDFLNADHGIYPIDFDIEEFFGLVGLISL